MSLNENYGGIVSKSVATSFSLGGIFLLTSHGHVPRHCHRHVYRLVSPYPSAIGMPQPSSLYEPVRYATVGC
jgi:hypothetical protein